ncbi:hypothetical protein FM107_15235 [Sphingobacterium sp. JB170]|nr:hypothetical protein FM107_15235 [Sphingobacterium sp. JB170]
MATRCKFYATARAICLLKLSGAARKNMIAYVAATPVLLF